MRSAISVVEHTIPKKVEKKVLHGHFTLEQIAEAKRRALEARRASFREISSQSEVSSEGREISSQSEKKEVRNEAQ